MPALPTLAFGCNSPCRRRRAALLAILTAATSFDASAQLTAVPSIPGIGGQAGMGQPQAMQTGTGQTLRIQPSISGQVYWTDNVNLVGSDRRSDFVFQITPRLVIQEKGANTSLSASISAPILLYANTGGENNRIVPDASISGTLQLYPRLLYVDGSIQVSQQYLSPFAPRPQDFISATNNRYTSQSYRISPYLKGDGPSQLHYELRDTNTWTNANATASANRAYTNEIIANVTQDPRPFGAAANYDRIETDFTDRSSFITQIGRLGMVWQPDQQWRFGMRGGYEDNHFPGEDFRGATYGVSVGWHPTMRTNLDADAEHRFFGTSYHVALVHRTPLSIWTLRASRDMTTYPQEIATLRAESNVEALLNSIFASRLTDPIARQSFVDQLIHDRGLPSTLASPIDLFTEQPVLQESLDATVSLLGARNSVLMTAYRRRTERIPGTAFALLDLNTSQTDNTQIGTNVVWSHRLTAVYSLSTSADWFRTDANDQSGTRSRQLTLQTALSAALSSLTRAFAGVRHQRFTSNSHATIEETAIFMGLDHAFR
jgi:uncharacterized protein (PEP-CTERM system associated)